ncbi:unnamed protein product [Closterium sp. Naga37s-1]|nr:unnamed protein product [Closterium sp. Naga37s-1]
MDDPGDMPEETRLAAPPSSRAPQQKTGLDFLRLVAPTTATPVLPTAEPPTPVLPPDNPPTAKREAAHGEGSWETSSEEEVQEAGLNLEQAAEDADGGDDDEEPVIGIRNAEPEEADVAGGASQAVVEGSQSGRRELCERDASRQEEQDAEGLRQQERRDWGVRAGAGGTQGERSRSKMGGPRASREEPRRWERPPVNRRTLDGLQAPEGWVGDGARSPGRQMMRKEGGEGEPRAPNHYWRRGEGREEGPSLAERRGQRQEERSGVAWTAGPREQWERRMGGEFRAPLSRQQ